MLQRSLEYRKAEFEERQYTDEWKRLWGAVNGKCHTITNTQRVYERRISDDARAGVEEEYAMRLGSTQIDGLLLRCRKEIGAAYEAIYRYDNPWRTFGRRMLVILYEAQAFFDEDSGTMHLGNMRHQDEQIRSRPEVLAFIDAILEDVQQELICST